MKLKSLNLISTGHIGNTTLPAFTSRGYLLIAMTAGSTGTINFGGGTGEIPLAADGWYEPYVVPTSEITVTTAGTFVIVSNAQ